MNEEFQIALDQLRDSLSISQSSSVLTLAVYLLMGGALSMYLRLLYAKFTASASDSDSITRIFPLLTIVTTTVIAVVKSSLALSLGLVGALSIVRFRAAIKEPEELVYLFLCVALGLSLGAEQPYLALALVAAATLFVVVMHGWAGGLRRQRVLLTVSGDSEPYFVESDQNAVSVIRSLVGNCQIQRLDIENGRGQVRIVMPQAEIAEIDQLVQKLRAKLPECEFSYVNLETAF